MKPLIRAKARRIDKFKVNPQDKANRKKLQPYKTGDNWDFCFYYTREQKVNS